MLLIPFDGPAEAFSLVEAHHERFVLAAGIGIGFEVPGVGESEYDSRVEPPEIAVLVVPTAGDPVAAPV